MHLHLRPELTGILAMLCVAGTVAAQDSTVTIPAAPSTSGGGSSNLVGMILPNAKQLAAMKEACDKCKAKICASCIGQMLGNMTLPLSLMTGGCIKPCCPVVSKEDLKAAADSPNGACARITKDQLETEERRKAVRCLAKVDCNWHPEAELALINALRTDKSECVRLEAARVLAVGCCSTRKVIEALSTCVNASSRDGNPPENSLRVREMALVALQRALACYVEREEPVRPEVPAGPAAPGGLPAPAAPAGLRPASFQFASAHGTSDAGQEANLATDPSFQRPTMMKGRIIELEDRPNTQMQTVDSGMKGAQSEAVEKQRVIFQALQVIKRNKANSTVDRPNDCATLGKGQKSLAGLFAFSLKNPSPTTPQQPQANTVANQSAPNFVIPADRGLIGTTIR